MEEYDERTTGTRDEHYNLISVLYHALNGADTCDHYAMDAEAAGDERLGAFFRDAQDAQIQIADRGKELLGIVESSPELDVEVDAVSDDGLIETEDPAGRGVPPTNDTQRTPPSGEDLGGRGVPPMSDAARSEGPAT